MEPHDGPDDYLDDVLEELREEGHVESQGVFTTVQEDALTRLSTRLLQKPERYLLKFVQALVAGGSPEIWVALGMKRVKVVGRAHGELDLPEKRWIQPALQERWEARKHLVTGILGAWELAVQIVVEWGSSRWTFQPGRGLQPERAARPAGQACFTRLTITRKETAWLASPEDVVLPRLLACPVPVLTGEALTQVRGWRQERFHRVLGAVGVVAEGEARLALPDRRDGRVIFSGPRGAELFLTRDGRPVAAGSPDTCGWRGARRVILFGPKDETVLVPVQAGVALDPIEVPLVVPGMVVLCSVEAEGLSTDLSQFQVRRDQALETLVQSLNDQAAGWRDELIKVVGTLNTATESSQVGLAVGFALGAFTGLACPLLLPFTIIVGCLLGVGADFMANDAAAAVQRPREPPKG